MPVKYDDYTQYRDKVAGLVSRCRRESSVIANIDSAPLLVDDKKNLVEAVEKLVFTLQGQPHSIVREKIVEELDGLSAKISGRKALQANAFKKIVEIAEERMRQSNDWRDGYALIKVFNELLETPNFDTPQHASAAVGFAEKMDAKKFARIAEVVGNCFKSAAATTPAHFKDLFAAAEKTHDAAVQQGLPLGEYSAVVGQVGVFTFLSKAFDLIPHRLNASQAKEFIGLTTKAIEKDGQLEDIKTVLYKAAKASKTQTPQQISRTMALLAQTAHQHGGRTAAETAKKIGAFKHLNTDEWLRIAEKAVQNKVRPHRALETYAAALQEGRKAAGDVEEGIENGVLLGPKGRQRLNQAIFSRKAFFDEAKKTLQELLARRPKDEFEAELRSLHY